MKKVLFVISSLGGGGAERVLTNIANYMVEDGVEVKILKTSSKTVTNYNVRSEIEIIQLPRFECPKWKKAIQLIGAMHQIFKQHSESTIVSFLSDNNMLSILAAVGLKNKVIISERNDPSKNCINGILRRIRNFLYRFADVNVCQTEDAKKYFSLAIQKKSCIIPNPILIPDDILNFPKDEIKNYKILAVGRLTPQKNYPMLLKAFKDFHEKYSQYTLEIYGDGELKQDILDLIKGLSLEECVTLCGFNSEIYDIMKNSTMYVSTSNYEGISNTMLEALSLGVPTIVTDCPVGGGRMVINDGVNGYLVPVGDSQALAAKMIALAQDDMLRKSISLNAINIRTQYALPQICKKWEEIL